MPDNLFIHPLADVKSKIIGNDTKIWQFTVILAGACIGNNCNICCHCFIENNVIINDNVTIKSGVYLWDGIRIGNNVFVGPNVSFINDKYPHSKKYPEKYLETVIGDGASIGAGAIIMGGIKIGNGAMIGAGSLVTKDVPPSTLWYGNPAKFIKDIK
jgi:UDP-2-acetamido-3-amino-2,3-dideoxy-glucuronate N-acetyltransferase